MLLPYSYYSDRGSDLFLYVRSLYLDTSFTCVLVFLGLWHKKREFIFSVLPKSALTKIKPEG